MKKYMSILLLSLLLLCGCTRNVPAQPHEDDFVDLENYILDSVGDDISFAEPNINDDNNVFDCGIAFTSEVLEHVEL